MPSRAAAIHEILQRGLGVVESLPVAFFRLWGGAPQPGTPPGIPLRLFHGSVTFIGAASTPQLTLPLCFAESSSAQGLVSRGSPVHSALRNCIGDEGGPLWVWRSGRRSQVVAISCGLAMGVSVAEKPGRHDRERRVKANCLDQLVRRAEPFVPAEGGSLRAMARAG
jgi:hypothetical protein